MGNELQDQVRQYVGTSPANEVNQQQKWRYRGSLQEWYLGFNHFPQDSTNTHVKRDMSICSCGVSSQSAWSKTDMDMHSRTMFIMIWKICHLLSYLPPAPHVLRLVPKPSMKAGYLGHILVTVRCPLIVAAVSPKILVVRCPWCFNSEIFHKINPTTNIFQEYWYSNSHWYIYIYIDIYIYYILIYIYILYIDIYIYIYWYIMIYIYIA